MRNWHLNSIASRIAITIVLAIILGVVFPVAVTNGVNYLVGWLDPPSARARNRTEFYALVSWGFINSRYTTRSLGGEIAALAEVMTRVPASERAHLAAEISKDALRVDIRDTPMLPLDASPSREMASLRRMIEARLQEPPRSIVLQTRPTTEIDDKDIAAGAARRPDVAAVSELNAQFALPDGQWLVITLRDFTTREVIWLDFHCALRAADHHRLAVVLDRAPLGQSDLGLCRCRQAPWRRSRCAAACRARTARAAHRDTGLQPHAGAAASFRRRSHADGGGDVHDLRTPLTRLRLRAEFIEDQEQQRRMLADLDSMGDMIDSTLVFLPRRCPARAALLVDLGALVEGVCENASDAGGAVVFLPRRDIDVLGRPNAIARAVANLVDNAVKNMAARRARPLSREPGRVVVVVDEPGRFQGIPPKSARMCSHHLSARQLLAIADTGRRRTCLALPRTVARASMAATSRLPISTAVDCAPARTAGLTFFYWSRALIQHAGFAQALGDPLDILRRLNGWRPTWAANEYFGLISISSAQTRRASSISPRWPSAEVRMAREKSVFGTRIIRCRSRAAAVSYFRRADKPAEEVQELPA